VATRNWGLLASGITSFLGICPLLLGSGKVGTPWERMQSENASAPFACADAVEVVEELPPPPHPQAMRARPTTDMTAAAARLAGGRGRCTERALSAIMPVYCALPASERFVFASACSTAWSWFAVKPPSVCVSILPCWISWSTAWPSVAMIVPLSTRRWTAFKNG
jgi:hypothetical protein